MTVIVVTACPAGLRGHLTRWLLEISPGVFVGTVNKRVRSLLWVRVLEMVQTGRALMVYRASNEQGLALEVHEHEWAPVDCEGLTLMLRPGESQGDTPACSSTEGWSAASRRRKFGRG